MLYDRILFQKKADFKQQHIAHFIAIESYSMRFFKDEAHSLSTIHGSSTKTKRIMMKEDPSVCPDGSMHLSCEVEWELDNHDWMIREAYTLMRKLHETGEMEMIPYNVGAVLFSTVYPPPTIDRGLDDDSAEESFGKFHKDSRHKMWRNGTSVHFLLSGDESKVVSIESPIV